MVLKLRPHSRIKTTFIGPDCGPFVYQSSTVYPCSSLMFWCCACSSCQCVKTCCSFGLIQTEIDPAWATGSSAQRAVTEEDPQISSSRVSSVHSVVWQPAPWRSPGYSSGGGGRRGQGGASLRGSLCFTTLYVKTTLIIGLPNVVSNCGFCGVTVECYFKTTWNVSPYFHDPMSGFNLERLLYTGTRQLRMIGSSTCL